MGKTPEEILQEARDLIGTEQPPGSGPYHVEYEPVRRYCHMVDDANPLFIDPEYAAKTKWGGVICPPFALELFAFAGPWPPCPDQPGFPLVPSPGNRNINMGQEWELLKPVRIGDRLTFTHRVADVYIKPIRLDPKAFWTVVETIYRNQMGEVVAIRRNNLIQHRTPEEVKEAGD